eukprot:6192264-Pleurochrysis_carterae.AAC.1
MSNTDTLPYEGILAQAKELELSTNRTSLSAGMQSTRSPATIVFDFGGAPSIVLLLKLTPFTASQVEWPRGVSLSALLIPVQLSALCCRC